MLAVVDVPVLLEHDLALRGLDVLLYHLANQSVAFDHLIDIEYSSLPISARNPCAATASPWVH